MKYEKKKIYKINLYLTNIFHKKTNNENAFPFDIVIKKMLYCFFFYFDMMKTCCYRVYCIMKMYLSREFSSKKYYM